MGWRDVAIQCVLLAAAGALVYGLSKLFRCRLDFPTLTQPRRSALCALLATLVGVGLMTVTIALVHVLGIQTEARKTGYRVWHLVLPLAQVVACVAPAAFFMARSREPLDSVGITRRNLWQSVVIAVVLVLSERRRAVRPTG